MAANYWDWVNRHCAYCPVLDLSPRLLDAKQNFLLIKERFRLAGKFYKVLAAHEINFINARACSNKRTSRMISNARKDHSIPLLYKAFVSAFLQTGIF